MSSRTRTYVVLAVGAGLLLSAALSTASARNDRSASAMRLQVCGRALCVADGTPFAWRGVTAFALAELVADGREGDARAFVRWAADTGFTVLRVLAMNRGWMSLTPEEGRQSMPRLLALAAEHGLHVQMVALAGTGRPPHDAEAFLHTQVREIARGCAAAPNCVLEIANEPYHSTQADLNEPARMQRLQREVPQGLPVAWGAAPDDRSHRMGGGSYVVVHRARLEDKWEAVARVRELGALSARLRKFVVDNEPIGAAEQDEPSRREDDPAVFFAQGALGRLFDIGSTFHCEDCLGARVPGPLQQRAAAAFIEGSRLVPAGTRVRVTTNGAPAFPVNAPGGSHGFAGLSDARAWAVVFGLREPTGLAPQEGWRIDARVTDYPGLQALSLAATGVSPALVDRSGDAP